ncbi:MAG: FAD-binding oxidoreductase [Candidatus Thorarchaeota archaeon]|nr:FAD-binding oxidoreductase [Candidatus Thorarchaeota archaeon]
MSDLKTELCQVVGDEYVSDGLGERYVYSYDMTENPPQEPALVVMPQSVEEVQSIVRLANRTKTPLVPFVTGQNVGGLTIPQTRGAVIVDLKRMDRIVELDQNAMYIVVEPGITFGHVRRYLNEHAPNLRYTYPLAPPYASVMSNALLQGLCDLSTAHGAMADFITGLEAVLPTGELVRVGSAIMGDGNWFGRYPLPDLVGLFSGWQGMTGIVTKIGLKLWPRLPETEHFALLTFGEKATTDLLTRICQRQIIDDGDCMSLTLLKMLLGVEYPVGVFEGEPDYATLLTLSANTRTELAAKCSVLESVVQEARAEEPRQTLLAWPAVAAIMGSDAHSWIDFPSDAFKILTEFDGLTWVGTYIHPARWGEALEGGRRIVEKYGFELMAFLKPMDGMHFGEFKFIIRFPKDEDTVQRVRRCNAELLDHALSLKAIPYKTPVWSAKKLQQVADPGFVMLLRKVKEALDPNGIMNPGRWGL